MADAIVVVGEGEEETVMVLVAIETVVEDIEGKEVVVTVVI